MPITPIDPFDDADTNHWIVTDGAAGNRRQAEALAAALGLQAQSITVGLRPPWSLLAPRVPLGLSHGLGAASASLLRAPPRLVIGCGRQASLVTRWLRERGAGSCQAIQILDPGIDPRHWDLVIAPRHDGLQGRNVLSPLGSLHPIDAAWLEQGRMRWPALGRQPAALVGLLVGGPRRGVPLDEAYMQRLLERLQRYLHEHGGQLLILCSRRTPPALQAMVRAFTSRHGGRCWTGPDDGPNPYQGVLAWADRLVVTADSVNMLSEACATGRPVHCVLPARPLPRRLASFVRSLESLDLLRDWDDLRPAAPPLREMPALAAGIRRRLRLEDPALD
ncbi:mitochondrial fission ELM1 family protein [Frateuria aurantia]